MTVPNLRNAFIAPWVYAQQDGRLVILIDEWGFPILDIPDFTDEEAGRLSRFTNKLNKAWSEYDERGLG